MSELLQANRQLFLYLNTAFASSWGDAFMVFITSKENWYLPAALLLLLMVWKGRGHGRLAALVVLVALVVGDQLSSTVLKPLFAQPRPCKIMEGFRLLVHCGSSYGFPSGHATNIAVFATVMAAFYRRATAALVLLAFLVGFSRIYVGVHFPLDVLAGWLLGVVIGLVANRIAMRLEGNPVLMSKLAHPFGG
ncbi:MAG TPA: phosphatase PAP2 family protein [Calditrichia bacterium]|nr:phosphatase PAP2 family protein [Calditrichia bacterium]HQV30949.1 phosphatase PAP2 family protein [Calditrichia bacterium]